MEKNTLVMDPKGWKNGGSKGSSAPKMTFEEYDSNYPAVFALVEEEIRKALPEARLEHVGSTSVPGLGGRGVLDIVLVAAPQESNRFYDKLLSIGYKDFPYAYVKPMLTGSAMYNGTVYPLMIYILPEDHEYVRGWLAFREYMAKHPEEVKNYEQVKKSAISSGKSDPRSYQDAKTPFLEELSKRIATK